MKIGILTLPLHTNYGGNLQAYALMTVLKGLGHDVILINRAWNKVDILKFPVTVLKRSIRKFAFGQKNTEIFSEWKREKDLKQIGIYTQQFIEKHIQPQTIKFQSTNALKRTIDSYNFDALIVGSDQVWRPAYTPNIEDYYFGFLTNKTTKRIAYAASFGTDEWTFTEQQTKSCSLLIKKFDAVSVREDSAVELCKQHFEILAEHVVDPTMLLESVDYIKLINGTDEKLLSNKGILVYVLDENSDKRNVINRISTDLALPIFRVNSKTEDKKAPIKDRVAPSTESWIKGFYDADFVITDSFHACVFSILFKKPFLVYGNEGRGMARFRSLLKMFNLEERLITDSRMLNMDGLKEPINWNNVEEKLRTQKSKAINFLANSLQ